MVEQGRTIVLFLSELTPRCEQIFPHSCCFQPVRRIRQQMGRTQARTIMERKWCAPAVPERCEPGAGPSGRPYFRSSVRSDTDALWSAVQKVALWGFEQGLSFGQS